MLVFQRIIHTTLLVPPQLNSSLHSVHNTITRSWLADSPSVTGSHVILFLGRYQEDHLHRSWWLGTWVTQSRSTRVRRKQYSVLPRTDRVVGDLYLLRDNLRLGIPLTGVNTLGT